MILDNPIEIVIINIKNLVKSNVNARQENNNKCIINVTDIKLQCRMNFK